MNPKLNIEKELTEHIGKEVRCPDGELRTLKIFDYSASGSITLDWTNGDSVRMTATEFWNEWPGYELARNPAAPVNAVELVQASVTTQTKQAELQAKAIIDTSDVTALLREQMLKVKNNSLAIPQAKTMGDLAKQIIEAEKLKLEAIKVIHSINQK